jgi:hypothetical protein
MTAIVAMTVYLGLMVYQLMLGCHVEGMRGLIASSAKRVNARRRSRWRSLKKERGAGGPRGLGPRHRGK